MPSIDEPQNQNATTLRPLSFPRAKDSSYAGRPTCLVRGLGVTGTLLLSAEETGGSHTLTLISLKPSSVWTPPVSPDEITVYLRVEGRSTIGFSGDVQDNTSATGAFVPPGVRCELENYSCRTAHILRLTLPVTSPCTEPGYLIGPEAGDTIHLGTHENRNIVRPGPTQGGLLWMDVQATGDACVPPHVHRNEDETFYIVSGRFQFTSGDTVIEGGPGHVVFAPRHIAHSWRCISPEGGRLQSLVTPGANFETFARTMAERGIVPSRDLADPVLAAQFLAINAQHGLRMVPPAHVIK